MHFLHLCIRVSQVSKVPDSDLGWEDMYREGEGDSWFDWVRDFLTLISICLPEYTQQTVPMTVLLITASILNAIYFFTRIKLYRLHHCPNPVSSPHATFVSAQLDFQPLEPPSLASRIRSGAWYAFSYFWRFLLGMKLPASSASGALSSKTARVQQLEVWTPRELEMMLFSVYSPAHAFLWMATGPANWMLMLVIMGSVGVQVCNSSSLVGLWNLIFSSIGSQLNTMVHSYSTLLKDKEIIAAEVMHEYNQGVRLFPFTPVRTLSVNAGSVLPQFVYPRVNPIRKDVAVMTHQSEVVNVWED